MNARKKARRVLVRGALLSWAACLALLAVLVGMMALPNAAAAGSLDTFQPLVNAVAILAALGILLGIGAIVLYLADAGKFALGAAIVSALFLLLAVGGWIIGALNTSGGDCPSGQVRDASGNCVTVTPPGYSANWRCRFEALAAGGPGGAHDAATEFPDSPFTAADGGTPDLNKVIAVPVIGGIGNKNIRFDVSVDDDVPVTTAGYLAEDAFAADVNCQLTNPTTTSTGALAEIPFWGRISIDRTTGTQQNGSYANVFYCDITAGQYLGLGANADSGANGAGHDADHSYVSYTNSNTCPGPAPLVGDWINLGTSDGDADGEWIELWYVLDIGLSDYATPPLLSCNSGMLELGTDPAQAQYKGNLDVLTFDFCIEARA